MKRRINDIKFNEQSRLVRGTAIVDINCTNEEETIIKRFLVRLVIKHVGYSKKISIDAIESDHAVTKADKAIIDKYILLGNF